MSTFVVCHHSKLVAYLVATSLRLLHGRATPIHVIELEVEYVVPGLWCGVSTISHERVPNWTFLQLQILLQVLRPALVFVDSIHVRKGRSSGQRDTVEAVESTRGSYFGIIYDVHVVLDTLRQFLLNSPNTFLSGSRLPIQILRQNLDRQFGPDSIWMEFDDFGVHGLSTSPFPMANTCSARIQLSQNTPWPSSHSAFEIRNFIWFPLARIFQMGSGDNLPQCGENDTTGSVNHLYNYTAIARSDLMWALTVCGASLQRLKTMSLEPKL